VWWGRSQQLAGDGVHRCDEHERNCWPATASQLYTCKAFGLPLHRLRYSQLNAGRTTRVTSVKLLARNFQSGRIIDEAAVVKIDI
jgi:hypothetical protein